LGAPPEINSVVNPVRATSVSLVTERMKKTGMEITPAAAAELTKQAQDALLQRLHQGGVSMPPFPHLSEVEIRALIEYLKQLAAVPGAKQLTLTESPVRVGEHIVKATCHTCHDATGANPSSQQLENGAIPPLETLTSRVDESQFIQKVTSGAVIVMGTPPSPHRGRMPVFYYLTKDEAADAYLYLTTYSPSQLASAPVAANVQQDASDDDPPPETSTPAASTGLSRQLSPTQPDGTTRWKSVLFLAALASFVFATMAVGLAFGGYELRRLGLEAESGREEATVQRDEKHHDRKLVA
jgi:mono/diheme cytochrome c family protein